jgi:hypothetical protein
MQIIAIMSVGTEYEIETFEEGDLAGFVDFSQRWFNTTNRDELFVENVLDGWTHYGTEDVNYGVFKLASYEEIDRILGLGRTDLEEFVAGLFNV